MIYLVRRRFCRISPLIRIVGNASCSGSKSSIWECARKGGLEDGVKAVRSEASPGDWPGLGSILVEAIAE